MPDTIRQQIIEAIAARLKTILTSSGYLTDLGSNVHEWDTTPLDLGGESYKLIYQDEEEAWSDMTVGEQDAVLTVSILILCASSLPISDIRAMTADVRRAMYLDPTWGGLASDTRQIEEAKMTVGAAADVAAGVVVKYQIEYTAPRGAA